MIAATALETASGTALASGRRSRYNAAPTDTDRSATSETISRRSPAGGGGGGARACGAPRAEPVRRAEHLAAERIDGDRPCAREQQQERDEGRMPALASGAHRISIMPER